MQLSDHSFSHEAMKTVFQLRLRTGDAVRAQDVALDCFAYLDQIEASLSRYLPGSDVWQINHLQQGESLFVSEECYECLRLALIFGEATGGLFDVTLGRQIEHHKTGGQGPAPALEGQLMIDEIRPQVHCLESGREIDLGGIGKGYALDALAGRCRSWGVGGGLLSAGASTQIAFGSDTWMVELRGDHHVRRWELCERALSASGTAVQGSHIVSPGGSVGDYPRSRVWVSAASAAAADAFSTAALLAPDPKLLQQNDLGVEIFMEATGGILGGNLWPR